MLFTAVLYLLATVAPYVSSTSDPAASVCETVCWEESVLENQCMTNLTCGLDPTISDEEFETCHQPCWKIAAPCRHRCRQWYPGVIRRCSAPSAPPNRLCRGWRRRFENWGITRCSEPTLIDCVLDLLMMKRARWLNASRRVEFELQSV